MNYVIHYNIAAFIVFLTIIIHMSYRKSIKTYKTRVYSIMLWTAILTTMLDIVTIITIKYSKIFPLGANYFINELYYFAIYVVLPFMYYVYTVISIRNEKKLILKNKLILVPAIVETVLIAGASFVETVFYFDENRDFHYGKLRVVLYIATGIYMSVGIIKTIVNRKLLRRRQEIAIYIYTVAILIATVVQRFNANLLLVQFATSIALLIAYMALENPDEYEDKELRILNKNAFVEIYTQYMMNNKTFKVLVIRVDGIKYINEILGSQNVHRIFKQIVNSLNNIRKDVELYRISDGRFALMSTEEVDWEEIQAMVKGRFNQPFKVDGGEAAISEVMCMLSYPDKISSAEHMSDMIEYGLNKAKTQGDDAIVYADESILEDGRRENKIVQTMRQALRDKTFEVYYQPIYSVEKKCYTSAEALLRLRSEEFGFISPDEFIPLAEKNGMILEIGEFVFREVCRTISEEKLWIKGIEYVDVNLSVVQCMQEKLHEKLVAIMDEYNLEYKYINLEITETAAIMSSEILEKNMKKLMEKGIKFSLDDYGTGFSNISTIIEYNFHTVKLDKSMVWAAMNNKKAMCALEYTIAMVKSMNMELIAEGVEDEAQVDMLTNLGCDFFQGYYYSRPVCKTDFMQKILK